MTDRATELLQRFIEERNAGWAADPAALIGEAGEDAEALSAMIAAYLMTQPTQTVQSEDVLALAARPELQPPRPWSELLPESRARRGISRTELIRRLAEALGVAGSEPQVEGYVHELEVGLRSPLQVRPAVVSALAAVLDVPWGLLDASRRLSPEPPLQHAASAFARGAILESREPPAKDLDASSFATPSEPPPDPRVDDLFTGGP